MPQACTRMSASPGPGSGTTIVWTVTGSPLAAATTPRTSVATVVLLGAEQERPDLAVGRLPEVAVPLAHGLKRAGHVDTHHLIGLTRQLAAGLLGADRHGDDD